MKFKRQKIARFQEQNCSLTLKEALYEFYEVNANIFSKPKADTKWTELLVHHDVSHVFFGVNINILDEAAGDYWTILATDLSISEYMDYANSPEGKALLKDIGVLDLIKSIIFSIPLFFRILNRSRKMTSKWQVRDYGEYLDMPLKDIREIFNLKILEYEDQL
jgi:hypothetical protein